MDKDKGKSNLFIFDKFRQKNQTENETSLNTERDLMQGILRDISELYLDKYKDTVDPLLFAMALNISVTNFVLVVSPQHFSAIYGSSPDSFQE